MCQSIRGMAQSFTHLTQTPIVSSEFLTETRPCLIPSWIFWQESSACVSALLIKRGVIAKDVLYMWNKGDWLEKLTNIQLASERWRASSLLQKTMDAGQQTQGLPRSSLAHSCTLPLLNLFHLTYSSSPILTSSLLKPLPYKAHWTLASKYGPYQNS
jgi:hypothetical protein